MTAVAEQAAVVPQACSLGWLLTVRFATGVLEETVSGAVPCGTVDVNGEFVVTGTLKLFRFDVSRSNQFFPSPALPM